MTTYSKFKSIFLLTALVTFIVPVHTQADEYKWLKTSKYEKIFVYTDLKECDFVANQLNEIRGVLSHSKIKPTISDSLIFQSTDEEEKSLIEVMTHKLIDNQKIFLYIYGKCVEYGSVYIYQFEIHFAILDKKYSNALLYSLPQHSVIGADTIFGIKKTFRKLVENAVADYLSANVSKIK